MDRRSMDESLAQYELIKGTPSYSVLWNTRYGIEAQSLVRANDKAHALEILAQETHANDTNWEFVCYNERGGYISSEKISL